jgi:hypothetical protein
MMDAAIMLRYNENLIESLANGIERKIIALADIEKVNPISV